MTLLHLMRHHLKLALLGALGGLCAPCLGADVLFRDSFEGPSPVEWLQTWGPAGRSQEKARTGRIAVREEAESEHGLSVWYTDFTATPGAEYTASAWVFVPAQPHDFIPQLSINRTNWNTLSSATTGVRDRWVRLETTFRNTAETRLRLQLYQATQKAGIGGALMYWDDVTLSRTLGAVDPASGSRINPLVTEGLDVKPLGGMRLRVEPGTMLVAGKPVTVDDAVELQVTPPRRIRVTDEKTVLTDEQPRGYGKGTALQLCRSLGTTIAGVLDPDSLRVKVAPGPDAERYTEGRDWRADKAWGRIGRIPEGRIGADTAVYIDYAVSLMRLDTIAVRSDGQVMLLRGNEHKMLPEPPKIDMYAAGLCNVFLPYHCRELQQIHLYPIGPDYPEPGLAALRAKGAQIPHTRAKLDAGEELTVVFWGDSVTCGGDASSQDKAFPLAFTHWLRCRYPASAIHYVNAGTGGWNSASKLPLFEEEVLAHQPDLVVIEFVNDMGFERARIFQNYTSAVDRIRAQGGEVIILTPHFTRPDWMGAGNNMRTPETREAVTFLREFAQEKQVGLADASRRWEYLWIEGIPYLTMLTNAINHPDDRGHQLFVEELKLFFLATPEEISDTPVQQQDMPDEP